MTENHQQDDFYEDDPPYLGAGFVKPTTPAWVMDSNGRLVYTNTGDEPWEPTLTPGAYLAKQRGCTCSRLDNAFGRGRLINVPTEQDPSGLDTEYSVTPGCPLHDAAGGDQNQRKAD